MNKWSDVGIIFQKGKTEVYKGQLVCVPMALPQKFGASHAKHVTLLSQKLESGSEGYNTVSGKNLGVMSTKLWRHPLERLGREEKWGVQDPEAVFHQRSS